MKPRRPSALTSPAPCGAFLCLSASPLNRAAQAPLPPRAAALPSALPLCPVRLVKPRRPGRATAAALSLCRFPCPVPPVSRAGLGKPRPAALAPPGKPRQPLAAGRCRPLTPPPVARPVRRPSAGRPPVIQTAAAPPAS